MLIMRFDALAFAAAAQTADGADFQGASMKSSITARDRWRLNTFERSGKKRRYRGKTAVTTDAAGKSAPRISRYFPPN